LLDGKHRFRLVLCSHKAAEVAGVCLLLMVRGHLVDITAAHLALAARTGLLAIVPALGMTFTRQAEHFANRWISAGFLGACGFLADAVVHPSHYPGAYSEAALTGLGTCAVSVLISYTPLGKRIDRLAELFSASGHDAHVADDTATPAVNG
jgi:hypothetical protein